MEIKKIINPANELMSARKSIRKYDTSVKINRAEMCNILQDAMTAPSSFNLQPWRFVVVDTQDGKELIKPFMMFNEQQWETSAAIIAVFGDMQADENIDKILSANVKYELMDVERKERMAQMITSYRQSFSKEKTKNDTNPIGGYMKKELTEALGLDVERYEPIILLSIGKAMETGSDTTRFSAQEVTQWK